MNSTYKMSYTCLVLGEFGVGKSSFINAITKKNECVVGDNIEPTTKKYKEIQTSYNGNNYIFIDTPGLNTSYSDNSNMIEIQDAILKYPQFRCILILLKFDELKLSDKIVKLLVNLIKCIPVKYFWEHVLLIRTHANTSDKKFAKKKEKVAGAILKFAENLCDYDDEHFLESKEILIPENIEEFYVDCDNDDNPDDRFTDNEEEFKKIFDKIKSTPMMFNKITSDTWEDHYKKDGHYVKRTIRFLCKDNKEIIDGPGIIQSYEYLSC